MTDEGTYLSVSPIPPPSPDVELRLSVSDGLSSDLIARLSSQYALNPDIFEAHLSNSEWKDNTKADSGEETWITRHMTKDYASVRWYRPVRRKIPRPSNARDRAKFLEAGDSNNILWSEDVIGSSGNRHRVDHSSGLKSNLLQKSWDIHANVLQYQNGEEAVAWEERATIWRDREGLTDTGMYLLALIVLLILKN